MNFGPMEIAIIAIVIFALFGYKKLPDATRAIGRSLRIFKGEMKGMKDEPVETKAEAQTVRGELGAPTPVTPVTPATAPATQPVNPPELGTPPAAATPQPAAQQADAAQPQHGTTPAN